MQIIGILQARTGSKRYKNKVLKKINNKTILEIQIERILRSKFISSLVVATSTSINDKKIYNICKKNNIPCYRGSHKNVLSRFFNIVKLYNPDHVVRLTADCPLVDPKIIDKVIKSHLKNKKDYTSNILLPTYPDGYDVEVLKKNILVTAYVNAKSSLDKEHVTSYINSRPKKFKLLNIKNKIDYSYIRLTLDYKEDLILIRKIFNFFERKKKFFDFNDVIKFLLKNPKLLNLNNKYARNEGFIKK